MPKLSKNMWIALIVLVMSIGYAMSVTEGFRVQKDTSTMSWFEIIGLIILIILAIAGGSVMLPFILSVQ